MPAHGSKSNQGRFFPCIGSALTLFLDILGGWLKWPQRGLRGVGENIFLLKGALNVDNSNNTIFSTIGHRNDKLFNFSTFLGIFGHFGGSKWPPGGLRGWVKIFFGKKDVFYLYFTNDTSFRSIGHHNDKLFNFSTFFGHFWSFWGGQNGPQGF